MRNESSSHVTQSRPVIGPAPLYSTAAGVCTLLLYDLFFGRITRSGNVKSFNSDKAGSSKMNTALEYSTRVVQDGGRRCKKSTLNDLVHLAPLRIPLMNPP